MGNVKSNQNQCFTYLQIFYFIKLKKLLGKPYNIISDMRRNNMENFDKKLNNYARLIIEKESMQR